MSLSDDPRWGPFTALRAAGPREVPGVGACFICEGRYLVEAALKSCAEGRLRVISVAGTPTAVREIEASLTEGTELLVADATDLSGLAGFPFHRGLLACVAVPPEPQARLLRRCQRLLVLPELHDAENLGLLLRSAAALGVDGVLAGPGPSLWNRRTVRVSMGAAWKVPVWRREDPSEWLELWKEESGMEAEIVGAALAERAEDARHWRPAPRTALVLGPEGPGLSEAWKARCDRLVKIPMKAGMDSLNVAAAGAILMFRMTGA